jgi:hypothetical protein
MIPELILDFFITFMEVFGGLKSMHVAYWDARTGADPKSKFTVLRVGDLPKSLFLKCCATASLTAFVLAVVMK